jgi:ribosomal protein S21
LIEARKQGGEPFERLFRRFNRKVQESGVLTEQKKRKYFEKEPNRSAKRRAAQRQAKLKKMREKTELYG